MKHFKIINLVIKIILYAPFLISVVILNQVQYFISRLNTIIMQFSLNDLKETAKETRYEKFYSDFNDNYNSQT